MSILTCPGQADSGRNLAGSQKNKSKGGDKSSAWAYSMVNPVEGTHGYDEN